MTTPAAPGTPPPWANEIYSTKRHGISITNCDSEPVQTPGCVQDCGALLVLRSADLTLLQVSENSAAWLGVPPEDLLGRSLADCLGASAAARVREVLTNEPTDRNPIYAGLLPARLDEPLPTPRLAMTLHTVDGLAIIELERATDAARPDAYALVRRAASRLQAVDTLQAFCDTAVEEVRRVTSFDRVMVYRFHQDNHGEVIAERKRDDLPPWLGLHYPAEDIPLPARQIFQKIWVRPLPDARAPMHELVPLANPDTGEALDMTYCALRGASTMYTEYLRNMGVAASLTMPIRIESELWGLIACHHYTAPAPTPWSVRAACELLAQMVSLQLRSVQEREHFVYRLRIDGVHQQLVAQAAQEGGLSAMTDGKPALLDGLHASGAALYHRERWWRVGQTPDDPKLDALATWLESRPEFQAPTGPLFATDCLALHWPAAAALAPVASGVLAFPIARGRRSLMVWFRPETAQQVKWAGSPHDKPSVLGPHGPRLTPRASFALFLESVRGRSQPWLPVEIDAAARLRLLVMELVVSRAEQLSSLNVDLSRSNEELDAFAYVASHDLKEPLRGIHKYAHQLLEQAGALDQQSRLRVEGLMRLTLRMDSLIDSLLHFSRVGRVQLEPEAVPLAEVLGEAVEMIGVRAAAGRCELVVPRPLPTVVCDRVRIREVLTNLLSNALKYNDKPVPRIEVGYVLPDEPGADEVAQQAPEAARGHAVYYVRDNGIGIDRRHFAQVWSLFKRLHGRDAFGGGAGVGLTIVKKLVERHGGQAWLQSNMGQGTTFFFTLPAPPRRTDDQ